MNLAPNSEFIVEGKIALALCYAKDYLIDIFNKNFNKTWPIEGYDVLIEEYNDYVSISFLPKTEQKVNGVPFEVSVKGVWLNGPGIELHISLEDFSLLLFKGMR